MVDTIGELNPQRCVAYKTVEKNDPYLLEGRPDQMFPGVLIVEAMLQTAALYASRVPTFDPKKHVVHLLMINKARFRRPVRPGETMRLEVKPIRSGVALWNFNATASVGEQLAASAKFVGVGVPIEMAQAFLRGEGAGK
jgi:3-hydroxyacyl-[acyl-carrier-protein] dehydratase